MPYTIFPEDVEQSQVLEKEIRDSLWVTELEKVNQSAIDLLYKAGLNIHGPLYSFLKDGVKLDFGFVFATEDFLLKHLSKEEHMIYTNLHHATDKSIATTIFSEDGQSWFSFDFDYDVLDVEIAIKCLYEYSSEENVRLAYKLPYLFLGEESDHLINMEGIDEIERDFDALATPYLTNFEEKLSLPIQELFIKCHELFASVNTTFSTLLPNQSNG